MTLWTALEAPLAICALLSAVVGQFSLAHGDGLKAIAAYAFGVATFCAAILADRLGPRSIELPESEDQSRPWVFKRGAGQIRRPLVRAALVNLKAHPHLWLSIACALGAVLLLGTTLLKFPDPRWYLPGLFTWILAMPAALVATRAAEDMPRPGLLLQAIRKRLVRLAPLELGLVASIVLVGCALRLLNLEGIPSGVHGDEVEFALVAVKILHGHAVNAFGDGFFSDSALFAYLEAPFIAFFGQTITGFRALGVLSGALTLPVFYLLLRMMFGQRPALLATALLAGNAAAVHFSRQALNLAEVPLASCLAWYCLWRAKEGGSRAWWLASGMFAGTPLYFQFGGRLFPLLIAVYFLYLLIRHRSEWGRWLAGGAWCLLGGAMALAPRLLYLTQTPGAATGHIGDRLIFDNWAQAARIYGTQSAAGILFDQLKMNLLGFLSLQDVSDFYTFAHAPLLPAIVCPLAALGLLLFLIRMGDDRYFLLGLWFWGTVLVGGVLSVGGPNAHRLLPAVLPALAGAALVLDWLLEIGPRLIGQQCAPVLLATVAAVPVIAACVDDSHYFGPAVASRPFEPATVQGKYVAALGTSYDIEVLGSPNIYFAGLAQYLVPGVHGEALNNPGSDIPLPPPQNHGLAFLIYPWMGDYLPLIQAAYPGSTTQAVNGREGPVFNAVLVPETAVASPRTSLPGQIHVDVRVDGGQQVQRTTRAIGFRDVWTALAVDRPFQASWQATLQPPQSGVYQLILNADSQASVLIDGREVVSTQSGSKTSTVSLAGSQRLEVHYRSSRRPGLLELSWITPNGERSIIPPAAFGQP